MTGDKENKAARLLPEMPAPERDRMNALPYWFPKIEKPAKNAGLKVPKTIWADIPVPVQRAFYMEGPDDMATITAFVDRTVRPAIRDAGLGLVFLKNGSYSHKFDARSACLPVMSDLPHAVMSIMYEAMLRCGFQYDGTDVLVMRERIGHDPRNTPCIYNGLPFRPEYRVFYDFDAKRRIFTAEYWDKDYVYGKLYDLTDKLVFDAWYDRIHGEYLSNKARVENLVETAMAGVSGLSGPWSVDVMQDENGDFWLIDMAVAEMSAYWDRRPEAAR